MNAPRDDSFPNLMTRLRNGDEQAAERVFSLYVERLIGLARGKLTADLRAKLDPDDVAQSAMRSFFRRQQAGQPSPDDWDELWRLLACITARKCRRWKLHFHRDRRSVSREWVPPLATDESASSWEAMGDEPSPAETAEVMDLLEQLMKKTKLPLHRRILELRLQGYTQAEIGREVERSELTVQLVMRDARHRLQRWLDRL